MTNEERERERGGLGDATDASGGHNAGHVERARGVWLTGNFMRQTRRQEGGGQKVKREGKETQRVKGREERGNTTKLDKQFTNQKSTRRAKADACLRCS